MNVPLVVAGSLSLLGAAVHGGVGDLFVVRPLTPEVLPSTKFGGPGLTKVMIRVSWHITTFAFAAVGTALLASGLVLRGDAARAIGVVAAIGATGFAAIVVGGALAHAPRSLRSGTRRDRRMFIHPGPWVLTAVAVLAWVGAL